MSCFDCGCESEQIESRGNEEEDEWGGKFNNQCACVWRVLKIEGSRIFGLQITRGLLVCTL